MKKHRILSLLYVLLLSIKMEARIVVKEYPAPSRTDQSYDINNDGTLDFRYTFQTGVSAFPTYPIPGSSCDNPNYKWYEYICYSYGNIYCTNGNTASANYLTLINKNYSFGTKYTDLPFFMGDYNWAKYVGAALTSASNPYPPAPNCYNYIYRGVQGDSYSYSYYTGKFLAFTFQDATGKRYYGWLGFEHSKLKFVYENIPGYPVIAGSYKGYFDSPEANYNIIKGYVYHDVNGNCIKDPSEKGIKDVLILTANGSYRTISANDGSYELLVEGGAKTHTVLTDSNSNSMNNYIQTCPAYPAGLSTTFNGYNQTNENINLGIKLAFVCPRLSIHVASDRRRRCFLNNTQVTYTNTGNFSSYNTQVKVILPRYVKAKSSVPAWNAVSGDTLIYNTGTLAPNDTRKIIIKDSVICGDESIRGLTQCTKAFILPNQWCILSPQWDNSDVHSSITCLSGQAQITLVNKGSSMVDSAEYRIFSDSLLIRKAKYKLVQNQSLSLSYIIQEHTLRIEADQSSHHPQTRMRISFLEGCGTATNTEILKNMVNAFSLENTTQSACQCLTIRDSYDPNDKMASPEGTGTQHKLAPNTPLTYTIRFQNTGTDDAYTVVLADTLSNQFDLSTLEILQASHPFRMDYRGIKGNNVIVWVFGNINLKAKSVNEALSHGYVTFKISPKSTLPFGTVIKNKAYIYFDYNSAIITNETFHTLGIPYKEMFVLEESKKYTLCTGKSITLNKTISNSEQYNYQWIRNGNPIKGATQNHLSLNGDSANSFGNYYCQIFQGIHKINSEIFEVKVTTSPKLGLIPTIHSCNGTSIRLDDKAIDSNNTQGNVTYWMNQNATTPLIKPDSITQPGVYFIQKTENTGLCNDIVSTEVIFHEQPKLSISNPQPACQGSIVDISQTFSDLNDTFGSISFWMDQNASQVLTRPDSIFHTGIYFIKKTDTLGLCSDIKPINVTFKEQPNLSTTAPQPVCQGTSVDISQAFSDLNNAIGSTSFWMDQNASIPLTTPNAVVLPGIYFIQKIDSSGLCKDIKPLEVKFYEQPSLSITQPLPVCQGSTVDISKAFSDLNHTFGSTTFWMDQYATMILSKPDSIASSGVYYIKKTDSSGHCQDLKQIEVNILPQPKLITSTPPETCLGSALDITEYFTDLNHVDGVISHWKDAEMTQPVVSPYSISASGTYYIKKSDLTGLCSSIDSISITFITCQTSNQGKTLSTPTTISIFPNPVADFIHINHSSSTGAFLITDAQGKIIQQGVYLDGKIDVGELSQGLYFIQLQNEQMNTTLKFEKGN